MFFLKSKSNLFEFLLITFQVKIISDSFFEKNEVGCYSVEDHFCSFDAVSTSGFVIPKIPNKNITLKVQKPSKIPVTTPSANLLMSTDSTVILKETGFPRTPVILIFSGFVICVLSIIIFWVFRCRQQVDEKPQTVFQNEYAPLSPEPGLKDSNHYSNLNNVNGCINMQNGKIHETKMVNNNNAPNPPAVPPHKEKSNFKEWYV